MSRYKIVYVPTRRAMCIWWPWRKAPRIYMPRWTRGRPREEHRRIVHEKYHAVDWENTGWWRWLRGYLFSRGFRFKAEARAYAHQIKWMVDNDWGERAKENLIEHYALTLRDKYWFFGKYSLNDCKLAITEWIKIKSN